MAKKKKNKFSLDKINDANKEILFDVLASRGVKTVTLTFDGSGDDGSMEPSDLPNDVQKIVVEGSRISVGSVWENGKNKEKWKSNATVEELVENICYDVLQSLYAGWENNDGAFGEFVLDVGKREIVFQFNQRYVESELFEHII